MGVAAVVCCLDPQVAAAVESVAVQEIAAAAGQKEQNLSLVQTSAVDAAANAVATVVAAAWIAVAASAAARAGHRD